MKSLGGDAELSLLRSLLRGRAKLRRFPSLQWSVGGKRFIRSSLAERLVQRGLIERDKANSKGISIFVPTEKAKLLYGSGLQSLKTDLQAVESTEAGSAKPAMTTTQLGDDPTSEVHSNVDDNKLTGS